MSNYIQYALRIKKKETNRNNKIVELLFFKSCVKRMVRLMPQHQQTDKMCPTQCVHLKYMNFLK